MKNYPRFSLCSNSIESRLRSILGAIFRFILNMIQIPKKQKAKSKINNKNGFASLIKLFSRYARYRIKFKQLIMLSMLNQPKKRFFKGSIREFCKFTRRHSFCLILLKSRLKTVFFIVFRVKGI